MDLEQSLSKLIESTTFTKDCTLGDLKITMMVLCFAAETKLSKIIDELSDDEDYGVLGSWKKYVVAMSICKIDGEKVPEIINVGDEKIERNLYLKDFLDKVPTKVIDTLFEVYTDLKEESEKSLDTDMVYTWFKDPEIRKKEAEEAEEASRAEQVEKSTETPTEETEAGNQDPTDSDTKSTDDEAVASAEDKVAEDTDEEDIYLKKIES